MSKFNSSDEVNAVSCALALGTSGEFIVSIDGLKVLLGHTSTELFGFKFIKDSSVVAKFFPGTAGGPPLAQGFRALPNPEIPSGLDLDLVFSITVKPGTTSDQLVSELASALVHTGIITANDALSGVAHANLTEITVESPSVAVPALSEWGVIMMGLLLALAGTMFIVHRQRGSAGL